MQTPKLSVYKESLSFKIKIIWVSQAGPLHMSYTIKCPGKNDAINAILNELTLNDQKQAECSTKLLRNLSMPSGPPIPQNTSVMQIAA